MKVALDAGHGEDTYRETGSKGVPGMAEYEFNHRVVEIAKPLLEDLGHEVIITQPLYRKDVSLSHRVNKANQENADIFLSFHADANSNKDARGHWAFYYHSSENGKRLADIWSGALSETTGTKHRGNREVRTDIAWPNFYVVNYTWMPAVLMEHAFMTNSKDLKLLKSESFRLLCAEAAVLAVCRYNGDKITLNSLRKGVKSSTSKEVGPMMDLSEGRHNRLYDILLDLNKRGLIHKKHAEELKEGKLTESNAIYVLFELYARELLK